MPELVAGRACGACNVCCVALTIDDPALRKVQGYRCPNTRPDHGCAVYETRPQTCRSFHCGWRRLAWVHEALRPDVSDVLVQLHDAVDADDGTSRPGVAFALRSRAALKAEGLAESVAAAVAAGLPTYMNVPGPPGYTGSYARIDDVLRHAVQARDKAGVLRILREVRAAARSVERRPVVLAPREKGDPEPGC